MWLHRTFSKPQIIFKKRKERLEIQTVKVDHPRRYFHTTLPVGFGVTFCNLKTHAQSLASE
jgi:hypothetical protein